ncbi:unnamed protein product [Meloidogyne enterolobii]|uniref:Uncharacterized protein n=1 Tax=Meloidogyne enterolobii TaxID=390850 RepID=A0ACB1AX08_MELEN
MFNGVQVEPGNELPVHHLKNAPRVTLNVDPESTFSIVMIDPDNLSRKNPSVAEWLHWLVANIPASNILEGINGGQHQQPYGKRKSFCKSLATGQDYLQPPASCC